jgi:hypothetical protein
VQYIAAEGRLTMKVNVDYELVLNAIEKIKKNEVLSENESEAVVSVLEAIQGDYIPSKSEMIAQQERIQKLNTVKFDSPEYDSLMKRCDIFENKYC